MASRYALLVCRQFGTSSICRKEMDLITSAYLSKIRAVVGKQKCQSTNYTNFVSTANVHTSVAMCRKLTKREWGVTPPEPMSEEQCAERVLKAIRAWDRFPHDRADKLTLDARFVEDLSFDSLDLVEISMAVEDEFEFEIEDDVAHQFKTPRDVFNYVAEREMVFDNEGI